MPAGLQVFDENGNERISITDRLTRLIFSTIVQESSSPTYTIDEFDSDRGVALTFPLSDSQIALAHQVHQSGSTVYLRAGMVDQNGNRPTGTDSLLLVFMYE